MRFRKVKEALPLALLERGELESTHEHQEFLVRCRLAELTISTRCVKLMSNKWETTKRRVISYGIVSLKANSLHDCIGHIFDTNFLILTNCT